MKTLLFIGCGLTQGLGDREALGWTGRLFRQFVRERAAERQFNLGNAWETLPDLARRAERESRARIESEDSALIYLQPGHIDFAIMPDGKRRTDATTHDAHLDKLISILSELAPVMVVGPAPVSEENLPTESPTNGDEMRFTNTGLAAASRRMSDICAPRNVPFFDLYEELSKAPSYGLSLEEYDGIHPTMIGHKLIADFIHRETKFVLDHADV